MPQTKITQEEDLQQYLDKETLGFKEEELKRYLNGEAIGFEDTEFAVEFLRTIRRDIKKAYGIDPLSLHALFMALIHRKVDINKLS